MAIYMSSRGKSRKSLGARWINAEPFIDHSLKVGELLRRCCIDLAVGSKSPSDFVLELVPGGRIFVFRKEVSDGGKKSRNCFTPGNTVLLLALLISPQDQAITYTRVEACAVISSFSISPDFTFPTRFDMKSSLFTPASSRLDPN